MKIHGNPDERYQPGDFVTYGGNPHVANDNVFQKILQVVINSNLVTGFNSRGDWGEDPNHPRL